MCTIGHSMQAETLLPLCILLSAWEKRYSRLCFLFCFFRFAFPAADVTVVLLYNWIFVILVHDELIICAVKCFGWQCQLYPETSKWFCHHIRWGSRLLNCLLLNPLCQQGSAAEQDGGLVPDQALNHTQCLLFSREACWLAQEHPGSSCYMLLRKENTSFPSTCDANFNWIPRKSTKEDENRCTFLSTNLIKSWLHQDKQFETLPQTPLLK